MKKVQNASELQRFQITFDDGSTTHEWVTAADILRTQEAPLLIAAERERTAAARDGRRPRFAIKAERIREILGG
ncbi:MAG: hypothetical protein HY060_10235 [Proteobacteria bacterium]|nr:hypothetical protein [Pseudomonadota bacterium]